MADSRGEADAELADLADLDALPGDVGCASQTARLLNLSHAYELPLYRALLLPDLEAVPAVHEASLEARRLCEILTPLRALPREWVPSQSLVRSFCGGMWLPW
jgi:hypothetical protein|eukprot:4891881-Prymnesium_polylepis.1